jgi:hypothetical protein
LGIPIFIVPVFLVIVYELMIMQQR